MLKLIDKLGRYCSLSTGILALAVTMLTGCDDPKEIEQAQTIDEQISDQHTDSQDSDNSGEKSDINAPKTDTGEKIISSQPTDDTNTTGATTDKSNESETITPAEEEPELVSATAFIIPPIQAVEIDPDVTEMVDRVTKTLHDDVETMRLSVSNKDVIESASSLLHHWASRVYDGCEPISEDTVSEADQPNNSSQSIFSQIQTQAESLQELVAYTEALIKKFDGQLEDDGQTMRLFVPPEYYCGARYSDDQSQYEELDDNGELWVPAHQLDYRKQVLDSYHNCVARTARFKPSLKISLSHKVDLSFEVSDDDQWIALATASVDAELMQADIYIARIMNIDKAFSTGDDSDDEGFSLSGHLGITLDTSEDITFSIYSEDGISIHVPEWVEFDMSPFRFVSAVKKTSVLSSIDFGGTTLTLSPSISCGLMELTELDFSNTTVCKDLESDSPTNSGDASQDPPENNANEITTGIEVIVGPISFGATVSENNIQLSNINLNTILEIYFGGYSFISANGTQAVGEATGIKNTNMLIEKTAHALWYSVSNRFGIRWREDMNGMLDAHGVENTRIDSDDIGGDGVNGEQSNDEARSSSGFSEIVLSNAEKNTLVVPLPQCESNGSQNSNPTETNIPSQEMVSIDFGIAAGSLSISRSAEEETPIISHGQCWQTTIHASSSEEDPVQPLITNDIVTCPEGFLTP